MSSVNYKQNTSAVQQLAKTHNGLVVPKASDKEKLVRLTMAHMLWENQFYVDGAKVADQLTGLTQKVEPEFVAAVAKEARTSFKLRHVPLLLMRGLAKRNALKASDLAEVIQRPDEMSEFLSLYWKDKKQPVSNQVKKGLAQAFGKFNEYSLAKWDKNSAAVSLRDVMFLTHPKPVDAAQEILFKKVAEKTLETPDTWETELSAGANKKETFSRLMAEKKLGALAFLRNLRNMQEAGVSETEIRDYSRNVNVERVLPFRFISAAKHAPNLEDMLEAMMFKCLAGHDKFAGKTVLLVDISGSMFGAKVSGKSDLERFDAAVALAILCREVCEDVEIFTFSNSSVRVDKSLRGFALAHALRTSQRPGGTDLRNSLIEIDRKMPKYARCIVFTDEQSSTSPGNVKSTKNYIINVGAYENGINHFAWLTISGFSEAIVDYLQMVEKSE